MRLKSISIALFRSIFELHFIYVVESVFIVFGKEKGMMCIHILDVYKRQVNDGHEDLKKPSKKHLKGGLVIRLES